MFNQRVPRIVEGAFADHAEALTGRATKKDVHWTVADAGVVADVLGVDLGDATADGRAIGEIKLVSRTMDRVVFDGCRHVETGLLEAETHPSRSCEQIDA